jgi:hypothetical protein
VKVKVNVNVKGKMRLKPRAARRAFSWNGAKESSRRVVKVASLTSGFV